MLIISSAIIAQPVTAICVPSVRRTTACILPDTASDGTRLPSRLKVRVQPNQSNWFRLRRMSISGPALRRSIFSLFTNRKNRLLALRPIWEIGIRGLGVSSCSLGRAFKPTRPSKKMEEHPRAIPTKNCQQITLHQPEAKGADFSRIKNMAAQASASARVTACRRKFLSFNLFY